MKLKFFPAPKESDIQRQIFVWAQQTQRDHPELELLNASMNGAFIPGGKRGSAEQALKFKIITIMQRLGGLRKGFPDLSLPVARGSHHGLYVELKRIGGKVSKEQKWWLDKLTAQGYLAVPAWGFNETTIILLRYLNGLS